MPSWRIVIVIAAPVAVVSFACADGLKNEAADASAPSSDAGGGGGRDAGPSIDSGNPNPVGFDAGGGTDSGTVTDSGVCQTTPPSNKCGLAQQCGCTGTPAQTCDFDQSTLQATCVTAGAARQGYACARTTQCALGLGCVFQTCRPYCDGDAGAPCGKPGTNICYQVTDTDGGAIPHFEVCQISCDVMDPSSCAPDGGNDPIGISGCIPDNKGNTDCEPAGKVAVNGTCDPSTGVASSLCAPGFTCAVQSGQTTGSCKKWCRFPNVAGDCASGTCGEFTPKVMVGTQEYGFCP